MLLTAVGCSASAQLSAGDARILAQLGEIAPRAVEVSDDAAETSCWLPSAHMIDAEQFRVLCRVHFDEDGASRYRDAICVGDETADPVTDACYPWAYYSDMPEYEDHPAVDIAHEAEAH